MEFLESLPQWPGYVCLGLLVIVYGAGLISVFRMKW